MKSEKQCPICSHLNLVAFIEIAQVPIHCHRLCATRNEATSAPRGDIRLCFCKSCGHIFNPDFDPRFMKYTQNYENSLHYSARFQAYAKSLAKQLINRYDLYNKDVIEIGCGKGDFLRMLCDLGKNRGIGFDPSFAYDRKGSKVSKRITFIQDFYSERYANYKADIICCRQVLEHIQDPHNFVKKLHLGIKNLSSTKLFFEVPNAIFTLRYLGIWDIIYEHCSYYSKNSLAHLFGLCGFEIVRIKEEFEGQYLCIVAAPAENSRSNKGHRHHDIAKTHEDVTSFSKKYREVVDSWCKRLKNRRRSIKRTVVWGAGSKGVTFLNILREAPIDYIVDINPHKQGMYLPGTGQKIVPPEFLSEYQPDHIIVMNPVYIDEIRHIAEKMNVTARLLTA